MSFEETEVSDAELGSAVPPGEGQTKGTHTARALDNARPAFARLDPEEPPAVATVVHAYTGGPACLVYRPHLSRATVQIATAHFEDRYALEVAELVSSASTAVGSSTHISVDGAIEWNCLRLSETHALLLGKPRLIGPPLRMIEPMHERLASGQVSRARLWLDRWKQLEVPGVSKENMQDQLALIESTDWSKTALGDMESWSPVLLSLVSQCLASPFPTMLNWGEDPVVIYNYPAALVAGKKHPNMMGQLYRVAWGEVWDTIKVDIMSVLKEGRVIHMDNITFFFERNGYTEESVYSYACVPCRDEHGNIAGFLNPFFETTVAVVAERRIRLLQEASHAFRASTSTHSFLQQVCKTAQRQAVDLPLLAFYSQVYDDDQQLDDEVNASLSSRSRPSGQASETSHEGPLGRRSNANPYAGSTRKPELYDVAGALHSERPYIRSALCSVLEGSSVLPESFLVSDEGHPVMALPGRSRRDAVDAALIQAFRKAVRCQEAVVIGREELSDVAVGVRKTEYGGTANCIVVLPILNVEQGERVIAIVGLNPHRAYDHDYQVFLDLFKAQVAHGLTSIRLVKEEVRRARMFAAIVKNKNEELHQLLEARTAELRSSEMKLSRMADISPAGMWRLSSAGEITFVNESWWRITGHPRDQSPDLFWESVHEDDIESVRHLFTRTVLKQDLPSFEFRWKRQPGDTRDRWCTGSSRIETDKQGQVIAATGVLSDITDKKLIELNQKRQAEEAIELREAQERFIDMTSHELRNPLSAIVLSADSSVERLQGIVTAVAEEVAIATGDSATGLAPHLRHEVQDTLEDLKIISHCCLHMTRLVDDVLTLSKLDNQFLVITPVPSRPTHFIPETFQIFKGEMQSKEIDSELRISPAFETLQVDYVLTDPSRVSQLLINLLTNAIKFTAPSAFRKISVTLDVSTTMPASVINKQVPPASNGGSSESNGGSFESDSNSSQQSPAIVWLTVAVKDSGRGLTSEEVGGLFQRFKQANPLTHISYGGSGLGLFICRKIAEQLGGAIDVSSEREKGSTFTFYIPAERCSAPAASHPDSPQAPGRSLRHSPAVTLQKAGSTAAAIESSKAPAKPTTPPAARPLCILVVEDNLVNQKLLQRHLSRLGCTVSVANNGEEAIHIIKRSRWVMEDGPPISCVLMDIEMPVLDGMGAIRLLRQMESQGKICGHIPTLAVTANAREEQIAAMEDAGFDGIISKPFKIPIIMDRICTLLGSSK